METRCIYKCLILILFQFLILYLKKLLKKNKFFLFLVFFFTEKKINKSLQVKKTNFNMKTCCFKKILKSNL